MTSPKKKSSVKKQLTPKRKNKSSGNDAKRKLLQNFIDRIEKGVILRPSEIKLFRQLQSESDGYDETLNVKNNINQLIFSNSRDAGRYVGISHVSITRNVKNGKLKQNSDGTFSRGELDKWIRIYGSKVKTKDGVSVETIREQQEKAVLRCRLARARREEIAVAQAEQRLASWEEIEREWSERVRVVAAGLEAWSDRLPALLIGRTREDIHKLIKAEVKELRQRFSRDGRYCPE